MKQVDVTDVNDNPPYLIPPVHLWIKENSPPHVVANFSLGDPDKWDKNHGPPFSLKLDPKALPHIRKSVRITYDPGKLTSLSILNPIEIVMFILSDIIRYVIHL